MIRQLVLFDSNNSSLPFLEYFLLFVFIYIFYKIYKSKKYNEDKKDKIIISIVVTFFIIGFSATSNTNTYLKIKSIFKTKKYKILKGTVGSVKCMKGVIVDIKIKNVTLKNIHTLESNSFSSSLLHCYDDNIFKKGSCRIVYYIDRKYNPEIIKVLKCSNE